MKELNDQVRRKRIETTVKVIGLAVAGFVVAPFVYIAIQGLVGLAVAGILSLAIVYATPAIAAKLANWRLKLLKAEAMKNPVETLQNQYVKKTQSLGEFREQIRIFSAQVLTFADQVKQYVKDGLDDAPTYVEQLEKMKRLLQLRQEKYQEATHTLEEFAETIKRTDRKWKMACAAVKMNEAAGSMEGDVFDKICIETSLESVQTKLNEAFADLEISLLDDDKEKAKKLFAEKKQYQLTQGQPSVIVVDAIESNKENRVKVKVS